MTIPLGTPGRAALWGYHAPVPVTAVGISHQVVPLEDVAALSVVAGEIAVDLDSSDSVAGYVLLSTCNRFELYFESELFHAGVEVVLAAIRSALGERADLVSQFEIYVGQAPVQHLLEVASGLESMVVGEAEIIGQVRDALAQAEGHTTAALHRLFHAALTTAKAVASQTRLGDAGRSIAAVGLDLVGRRHFALAGRSALVIGTGSYARVVTAALRRLDCDEIAVYSPSGRAERFATSHDVRAIPVDELPAALAWVDLLVTCSGSEQAATAIVTAELLTRARSGNPALLPILDLSLTGDVDVEAATLPAVDLIDLDEIGTHAPAEQSTAVIAARDLVSRGVDTYLHLESGRAATPAVTAMRSHVSQFIEREIESANRHYDPETAAAVARSLRRVSNSLLHTPSMRAAELARAGDLADYQHALHTLFGIDVEAQA